MNNDFRPSNNLKEINIKFIFKKKIKREDWALQINQSHLNL